MVEAMVGVGMHKEGTGVVMGMARSMDIHNLCILNKDMPNKDMPSQVDTPHKEQTVVMVNMLLGTSHTKHVVHTALGGMSLTTFRTNTYHLLMRSICLIKTSTWALCLPLLHTQE